VVRCRVAALAKAGDCSEVIPGVSVFTFTDPIVAIHRIRRPQVVQVGGHREFEN